MRIAAIILVLIHALFSVGCASQPTQSEVQVPFAVPCVNAADVPPPVAVQRLDKLMHEDRRKRTLSVWDERGLLMADDAKLRALIQACIGGK